MRLLAIYTPIPAYGSICVLFVVTGIYWWQIEDHRKHGSGYEAQLFEADHAII